MEPHNTIIIIIIIIVIVIIIIVLILIMVIIIIKNNNNNNNNKCRRAWLPVGPTPAVPCARSRALGQINRVLPSHGLGFRV